MPHRRNDPITPPADPAPARWRVSSYCGASNTCVALAPAPRANRDRRDGDAA
ncbi:DUF397 domain-containing protein [Actinomadura sp. KC216]|uniref:DUF397 domain-containing protein n=1 Tax=Actinomadura sp. KC216 TaxID=2530370 RepID=UPI00140508AB|nr:DUF397 domain-containing protein [Actinomadura sp. KC216]